MSGHEGRHILLAAPKCCGKTSLLDAIKKDVQDSRKIVVMMDSSKENPDNTTSFLEKIFNEAIRIIGEKHPGSVDKIDFVRQEPIQSFRELFDTIKDKFDLIILLLDNYDSLASNAELIRYIGVIIDPNHFNSKSTEPIEKHVDGTFANNTTSWMKHSHFSKF